MKAFYVSNFTRHPKIVLENNQIIDLFDNGSEQFCESITTVIKDFGIHELIVNNTRDQDLFNFLNSVSEYGNEEKLIITLQEHE